MIKRKEIVMLCYVMNVDYVSNYKDNENSYVMLCHECYVTLGITENENSYVMSSRLWN